MRSFQHRLSEFDARGIRVVGISVDPPDVNQTALAKARVYISTAFRSGRENHSTIRRAASQQPDQKGADIARPAEFLLDSDGIVRWVNLTENIAVRARPEQALEALNQW